MEQYFTFMDRAGSAQESSWLDEFLELKVDPLWLSVPRLTGSEKSAGSECKFKRVSSAGSILNSVPQLRTEFRLSSSRSLSKGSIYTTSRDSITYELTSSKAFELSKQFFEEGATCNKLLEQLGSGLFFNDPKNVFVSTLDVFSPVKKEKTLLIDTAKDSKTFDRSIVHDSMCLIDILAHSSPLKPRVPKKRQKLVTKTVKGVTTSTETSSKGEQAFKLEPIENADLTISSSAVFDSGSDPDYSDDPRPKKLRKVARSTSKMPVEPKLKEKRSAVAGPLPVISSSLTNKARLCPKSLDYTKNLIALLDQSECTIKRERYERLSLEKYVLAEENIIYEANRNFCIKAPYQQEFTRVEVDPVTKNPFPATRSALCAYCEDINFFELKNSSYSQHMCHTHGIFTNNYLTPDPLYLGKYSVKKPCSLPRKTNRRSRQREGVVCPVCYAVVEIRCWKTKLERNPFSNYLRHFKKEHRMVGASQIYFLETKN